MPSRALLLSLTLLQFCFVTVTGNQCGGTVLTQDFNTYPGTFRFWSEDRADELFPLGPERRSADGASRPSGPLKGGAVGLERLMVGHNMAKINHRAGCVGAKTTASDGRPCGVLLQVRLAKPLFAATLSYKVKFSRDYDWTLGGKLPGLCSENCPVGCRSVGHNAGWSNRIMWRKQGHLVSYAYHPDKERRCGVDFRWGQMVKPGEWHEIKLYMKMNVPGIANGVQKVWLNGVLVFEKEDMLYRNRPGHKIEKFLLNNFHGGNANGPNASDFAPEKDQAVWIDDILIQEGECPGTPGVPLQEWPVQAPNATAIAEMSLMQQSIASLSGGITSDQGAVQEFRLRGDQ